MKDPLKGLSDKQIRALARKQLLDAEKRRSYQRKWRGKNKDIVAKYNRDYVNKKKMEAGVLNVCV